MPLEKEENMKEITFDSQRIAEGYKDRPYLHNQVIEQFQKDIPKKQFHHGLDIGCGAGLSTKALKQICDKVVGVDASSEMISVAKKVYETNQGYNFVVSKAEEISDLKEKFDIVTAAGMIQWVNQEAFLTNLNAIMNDDSYVLIYDFGISDQMKDNVAYTIWWNHSYLKEFSKPFRNERDWTNQDVKKYGFSMINQIYLEMEYEFNLESFIKFMLIQTNVNDKIEGEGRCIEEVYKWFENTLTPIFNNTRQKLVFTGYSWYLVKN